MFLQRIDEISKPLKSNLHLHKTRQYVKSEKSDFFSHLILVTKSQRKNWEGHLESHSALLISAVLIVRLLNSDGNPRRYLRH